MSELNLRPKRGLKVPMEDGRPWPVAGTVVENTLYVRRRIADGDVVEVDDKAEPEAETAPAPADADPAGGAPITPEGDQSPEAKIRKGAK